MNQPSVPRIVLSDSIKFLITISVFIASIVLAYSSLKIDGAVRDEKLTNILTNHLPHINEVINEIKATQVETLRQLSAINEQVIKLNTLLGSYDIKVIK